MYGCDIFREQKLHSQIDDNTFIFIKNYDINNQKGYNFDIQQFSNNKLIKKISGSNLIWNSEKKQWLIKNYTEKEFTSNQQISINTGKEKLITLKRTPEQIFQQTRSIKSMNFIELKQFVSSEKKRGNELLPI